MLCENVAKLRSSFVPLYRQTGITFDTPPIFIKDAKTILGFRHVLLGRFHIPLSGLRIVALRTTAILVHHSKSVLCVCISGPGKRLPFFQRLLNIPGAESLEPQLEISCQN